jgi:hypothetical protein
MISPNPTNTRLALRSKAVQKKLATFREVLKNTPEACLVPPWPFAKARTGDLEKPYVRASLRLLLWTSIHGTNPLFTTPICGCAGCINPAHQLTMEELISRRDREKLKNLEAQKKRLEEKIAAYI